jgi:hypothetical protein
MVAAPASDAARFNGWTRESATGQTRAKPVGAAAGGSGGQRRLPGAGNMTVVGPKEP